MGLGRFRREASILGRQTYRSTASPKSGGRKSPRYFGEFRRNSSYLLSHLQFFSKSGSYFLFPAGFFGLVKCDSPTPFKNFQKREYLTVRVRTCADGMALPFKRYNGIGELHTNSFCTCVDLSRRRVAAKQSLQSSVFCRIGESELKRAVTCCGMPSYVQPHVLGKQSLQSSDSGSWITNKRAYANAQALLFGDPSESRTPDTMIKSHVLCHLS